MWGLSLRESYDKGETAGPQLYASAESAASDSGVGRGMSAADYFDQIRGLILNEYVEPISNETNLGRGAIRGLLSELGSPESRFYEPAAWAAYTGQFDGKYSGIGADLAVRPEIINGSLAMPIRVISAAEGGPAANAGLLPGDWIDELDGKWVSSRSLFQEVETARRLRDAKKLTAKQFDDIFSELRRRSQNIIAIPAALDKLLIGKGACKVKIRRGTVEKVVLINRVPFEEPTVEEVNGTVHIRAFGNGTARRLASFLEGKDRVTLDLRGNPGGSMTSVSESLEVLLPAGPYANLQTEVGGKLEKLALGKGTSKQRIITVLVDKGTAREAELFVAALRARANAVVQGKSLGLGERVDRVALPDGSGYTLVSGRFFDLEGKPLYRETEAEAIK
jgi:carboxyl-terminal processing protease